MALVHNTLTWIRNGEPVAGTNDPTQPLGPANRLPKELLENDIDLDARLTNVEGRVSVLEQYLSGASGQATPDYLVLPVGVDKFAPDL